MNDRQKLHTQIAELIRHYRKEAGLTQECLAERVCLDRAGIAKIEASIRAVVPVHVLADIADALECPLWALIPGATAAPMHPEPGRTGACPT